MNDLLEVGTEGFEGIDMEAEDDDNEGLGGGGTKDGGGGITKFDFEERWGPTEKSEEGTLTFWTAVELLDIVVELCDMEVGGSLEVDPIMGTGGGGRPSKRNSGEFRE